MDGADGVDWDVDPFANVNHSIQREVTCPISITQQSLDHLDIVSEDMSDIDEAEDCDEIDNSFLAWPDDR